MSEKLFVVYGEPKDKDADYKRRMTKSDVYWFGTEEHLALQQYRHLARCVGTGRVARIKCIDLESLSDYTSKQPVDDMISILNAKLYNKLNKVAPHRIASRATTNQLRDSVTYSFSFEPIRRLEIGEHNKASMVHFNKDIESFYVEQDAFVRVFPILLDRQLRLIDEFLTPVKVNINGKTYRKIQQTNQN